MNKPARTTLAGTLAVLTLSACSFFGSDDGGGGGAEEIVTTNTALVSQYTLVARNNEPGSPFTDDQMVMVVVGESTLTIDDGAPLTDPFKRSSNAEIIWLDADQDIEYALSNNNSGNFNRIDVGDASNPDTDGEPEPLGRLVEADGENGGDGGGGGGDGGGGDGEGEGEGESDPGLFVTGFVDGNPVTLSEDNNSQFATTQPTAGYINVFAQAGDGQSMWTLQAPLQVGNHACRGETAGGANNEIELSVEDAEGVSFADGSNGSSCTISITEVSPIVEGTFEATAFFDNGTRTGLREVTNGQFRADPP